MSASTIRKALGTLQDDSDHAQAWAELEAAIGFVSFLKPLTPPEGSPALEPSGDPAMSRADLVNLLGAAKSAHQGRGEEDAVAHLLSLLQALAYGSPGEIELVQDLARVLDERVLDDTRSALAYARVLELVPGDPLAEEALERSQAKRGKWSELVTKYVDEARSTEDSAFKSSLLHERSRSGVPLRSPDDQGAGQRQRKEGEEGCSADRRDHRRAEGGDRDRSEEPPRRCAARADVPRGGEGRGSRWRRRAAGDLCPDQGGDRSPATSSSPGCTPRSSAPRSARRPRTSG
jgi:hypothetical protein